MHFLDKKYHHVFWIAVILLDFAFLILLFQCILFFIKVIPIFSVLSAYGFILLSVTYLCCIYGFKESLGFIFWDRFFLKNLSLQNNYFFKFFLQSIALLFALYVLLKDFQNPFWQPAHLIQYQVTDLDLSHKGEALAFYYLVGLWPKFFQSTPIVGHLVYEKGPPKKFLGKSVFTWDERHAKVFIEGPKSPDIIYLPEELKKCLLEANDLYCYQVRYNVLKKHFDKLSYHSSNLELYWFEILNPYIEAQEQPQGFHVSIETKDKIEDRFVFITQHGAHQTMTLQRSKSVTGLEAFDVFKRVIMSQRQFARLNYPRAWINEILSNMNLHEIESLTNLNDQALKLFSIQSALISKISVDPGNLDAYFHLSGTARILKKIADQIPDIFPAFIQKSIGLNIQNAYRFALDILPFDAKTYELEKIWLESQSPH